METVLDISVLVVVLLAISLAGKFNCWEHRRTPEEYAQELHDRQMNSEPPDYRS